MHTVHMQHGRWHDAIVIVGALMVVSLFLLTGCGYDGSQNPPSTGAAGAPTQTSAPISNAGNGSAQGCPSNAAVTNPPPKANEVVVPAGSNTTVFTHPGDVIEIHLPFGKKWTGPSNSQGVLELQQPAGYAWSAGKACIWRFTAKNTGTARLSFTMRPLCKSGAMCPMYIVAVPVTIAVK